MMAAKTVVNDDNFSEDVFACQKSLYEATKFDAANIGHYLKDERSQEKPKHFKANLNTTQVRKSLKLSW